MDKRAFWVPDLIVSTFGRTFPREIVPHHRSILANDYSKPRYLVDANIYLAFVPRRPVFGSPLMSCLAVNQELLDTEIVHTEDDDLWSLGEPLRSRWFWLEARLLDVANYLWTSHPHASLFPYVAPPKMPFMYEYLMAHDSYESAKTAAQCALRAFPILTAYVTFIFSLWLSESVETAFDEAFNILAERANNPLSRLWLESLRQSMICNISAGLRPGGFLDPYTTQWGPFLYRFVRASVPIWLVWGSRDTETVPPFMHHYFPTPEVVSEMAVLAGHNLPSDVTFYGPPVPPHSAEDPRRPIHPDVFDPNPTTVWRDASCLSSDTAFIAGFSLIDFDLHGYPPVRSRLIVDGDGLQKPGECWLIFQHRMQSALAFREESETRAERAIREQRLLDAEDGPSATCTVFYWVHDENDSEFFRRTRVIKSEVTHYWSRCAPFQRHFWAHINQWDLTPQVNGPPHVVYTITNDEVEEAIVYARHPLSELATLGDGHLDGGLEDVYDIHLFPCLLGRPELELDPYERRRLPAFNEYLNKRFGYTINPAGCWHQDLHVTISQFACRPFQPQPAIKAFLYDGQRIHPSPNKAQSIVNLYNALLNTTLSLKDLPIEWDISLHTMFPNHQVFALSWFPGIDGRQYYTVSVPGFRYMVATTSASTVLMILRHDWYTIPEVSRGLFRLGVAFRTIIRQGDPPAKLPTLRYRAEGLGWRPQDFHPDHRDYVAYKVARDEILATPAGRAICLKGGLAARIASDFVPAYIVGDGPLIGNEIVGHDGQWVYVDDYVGKEHLDIVLGVYRTSGGQTLSWWPDQQTWEGCALNTAQWTPAAEDFYSERLTKLRTNHHMRLLSKEEWEMQPRFSRMLTSTLESANERISGIFLNTLV